MNKITLHHLSAEEITDEQGPAIVLTQSEDGFNEPDTVLVHPWQLRAVCEQFGIIASDPEAARTIAVLQRRMLGLLDRINSLAKYMAEHSDHEHADLSYETTQLRALQDLAGEWCAEWGSNVDAPPCHTKPVQPEQGELHV